MGSEMGIRDMGIKQQVGTVLSPDAGRIGGVTMLERTADLAKTAKLKLTPMVQGGPFSLLTVARSLSGREEVLWVACPFGSYTTLTLPLTILV